MERRDGDSYFGCLRVCTDFRASNLRDHVLSLVSDYLSDFPLSPVASNFHFSTDIEKFAPMAAYWAGGAPAFVSAEYDWTFSRDDAFKFAPSEVFELRLSVPDVSWYIFYICWCVGWDEDVYGVEFGGWDCVSCLCVWTWAEMVEGVDPCENSLLVISIRNLYEGLGI